jgi:hypothetical protein
MIYSMACSDGSRPNPGDTNGSSSRVGFAYEVLRTWLGPDDGRSEVQTIPLQSWDPSFLGFDETFDEL